MISKSKRKGQAAIEFLMTYGWMLLVVLIVGSLIFSFVDFTSLLPNRLDLTDLLLGDSAGSLAIAGDPGHVILVVKNIAGRRILLNATQASIDTDIGGSCTGINVSNININKNAFSERVTLLNTHKAVVNFNCTPLIYGDLISGSVIFIVQDPETGIKKPIKGTLRLKIT